MNPAIYSCENGKYLGRIIDSSVITCNEIIGTIKTVPTKTVLTKITSTSFYILLAFLLTAIALLITISIYWIKYRAKQKHLLRYHDTN